MYTQYFIAFQRKLAQETEEKWAIAIEESLQRNMNALFSQGMKQKSQRAISLYPFLKVLGAPDYTRIIVQVIHTGMIGILFRYFNFSEQNFKVKIF